MNDLSHFDERGASRMVDVGDKAVSHRLATAHGSVRMQPATLKRVKALELGKGNVLEVARLAGIMSAKRTDELIPLCHSLPISSVSVDFQFPSDDSLSISATVTTTAQTGVEMEALMAVSIAALTVYDMTKSIDRGIEIGEIFLVEKKGGKSGHYQRETPTSKSDSAAPDKNESI